MVRLKIEVDRYGDSQDVTIQTDDKIEAIVDFPDGVPLYTDGDSEVSRVGSFIYDVLPIEAFFRFEDNVAPDDYIVMRFFDQKNDGFIQVYKVAELIGNMGVGVLSMRYSLAPYNALLSEYPNLKSLIESYELEAFNPE